MSPATFQGQIARLVAALVVADRTRDEQQLFDAVAEAEAAMRDILRPIAARAGLLPARDSHHQEVSPR